MKLAKNLSMKGTSQDVEIAGQPGCSLSLSRPRVDAPSQEIRSTSSGHRPSGSSVVAVARRAPSLIVTVGHCRSLCSDTYSERSDAYSDGLVVGPSARRPLLSCSADANLGAYHLPPLGAGFFMSGHASRRSDVEGTR